MGFRLEANDVEEAHDAVDHFYGFCDDYVTAIEVELESSSGGTEALKMRLPDW